MHPGPFSLPGELLGFKGFLGCLGCPLPACYPGRALFVPGARTHPWIERRSLPLPVPLALLQGYEVAGLAAGVLAETTILPRPGIDAEFALPAKWAGVQIEIFAPGIESESFALDVFLNFPWAGIALKSLGYVLE
jgi:hypothetical protein